MPLDSKVFDFFMGASRLLTGPGGYLQLLSVLVDGLLVKCFRHYALKARLRLSLLVLAVPFSLLALYYASHLEKNPITNRRRFIAFTPSEFAQKIDDEVRAIQDFFWVAARRPSRWGDYRRTQRIASSILAANRDLPGIANKTWSFVIVRSSTPSAFVLPNCRTYIFDGIFKLCRSDNSLSFVLAHEIAHCLLDHTLEKESLSFLLDRLTSLIWLSSMSLLSSDVKAMLVPWFLNRLVRYGLFLPYSRSMELESDTVGLQMIAKACFDFRYSIVYFDKAMALGERIGARKTRKLFSTHPTRKQRARRLYTQMNAAMKLRKAHGCSRLPPLKSRTRQRIRVFLLGAR